MLLRRIRILFLVLAVVAAIGGQAQAQSNLADELIDKFNALLPFNDAQPMSVGELCHRLDCLADELRKDGQVVIKQPDVFSQARMTRFRYDFEQQMSADLGNFYLVLAARINRLDAATTTSTTALGAALAAPGTTNVTAPPASASQVLGTTNNLFTGGPTMTGPSNVLTQGAFGSLGVAPQPTQSTAATAAMGLGVDPTVYLDEKKRFLEHLNEIRRINLGPDQNDSSGYGLYLVRFPVSITPGECTREGHGADLAISTEHEFTPDFLPETFESLVINDVVGQLGPLVYEAIRSGFYEEVLKPRYQARMKRASLKAKIERLLSELRVCITPSGSHGYNPPRLTRPSPRDLTDYILRTRQPLTGEWARDEPYRNVIAERIDVLTKGPWGGAAHLDPKAVRDGGPIDELLRESVEKRLQTILCGIFDPAVGDNSKDGARDGSLDKYRDFILALYSSALPDDVEILERIVKVSGTDCESIPRVLAGYNGELLVPALDLRKLNINRPSVFAPGNFPIAAREAIFFFLEECVYLLCKDAQEASRTKIIRSNEVCANLRDELRAVYGALTSVTHRVNGLPPTLDNDEFMADVLRAIQERAFDKRCRGESRELNKLYKRLVDELSYNRDNIRNEPIAALCWAIVLDAAMLDARFRADIRKVFMDKGLPCDHVDSVRLYYPKDHPNDVGKEIFCEYVKRRWPILTFALEPVVAEQNIADSFNLKRDLQLALSFAFSTGQINFSQLDTFRRKIEQSADTIALNRTVTAFAHGDNNFEFRFTPRFQNPPSQRTNLAVIASQFISGGPGPDYPIRKSKLEPGMHELTAVVLAPTFLPVMRMNVSSNWFKLTDPHHPVFHTAKMMERGRRAQKLRTAAAVLCNADQYRDADRRVLESKLQRLEEMLPLQSRVVQLPYENSASGFDLFSDGVTALVPMLTGYSGVDVITAPGTPAAGAAATTSTTSTTTTPTTSTTAPSPAPPTFSVTTLASGSNPTATYTLAGGATTIADVFVFGKSISLLDTRVIAGGRVASFEILSREVIHVQIPANVIPTTTEDGENGKTYIEIYVATPTGISNSIFVPYCTSPTPPAPVVAYDVAPASQSMDVYYQWLSVGGKRTLVATADPGKGGITISWDSSTGLAPRQIMAQFCATSNGRNVIMCLPAAADAKGDYTFDAQTFVVTVLDRLAGMTVYPALPPSPLVFTVQVQPFEPNAMEGLRSESTPKQLKSTITVNLQYNATGKNVLPNVTPVVARPDAPAAIDDPRIAVRAAQDPALTRTAQQPQSTSASQNATQPSPPLYAPPLLGPNVSSEAEQVAKLLTGQPIPTTVTIPPSVQAAQAQAAAQAANAAIVQAARGQVPSIVVNPSPVVVVSPPPTKAKPKQHTSRFHQMLNRIGNRMSAAVPPP